MKTKKIVILLIGMTSVWVAFSQRTIDVEKFDKIIISPHIQVNLVQGESETVTIESSLVEDEKINVEVNGNNLRIYLDDAKEFTKNEKVLIDGVATKRPIYNGTVVVATITYNTIEELSIRGEEKFSCSSNLVADDFELKIYGESKINFEEMNIKDLKTVIYGEAELEIESGKIDYQKYTAYGECKVDAINVENEETKITAHGEAEFKVNCSDILKVTSYGAPLIEYTGNAEIYKGITLGEVKIRKLEL